MNPPNANQQFCELFVDELARSGLRHVCLAPGSRSTPLTLAFAAHPLLRLHLHLDERCAAFYALGIAKATDQPVAFVCTSGSAAVNFFPAIVEASMSRLPLLALTADRPHELRHSGANQTIDQVKLYGDYALWAVDMPLPEVAPSATVQRNAQATAARALAIASGPPAGVVHLNFPFRKPLEAAPEQARVHTFSPAQPSRTRISMAQPIASQAQLSELRDLISTNPNGAIVCGPNCPRNGFANAAQALSRASGYPIFAEALSNVRFAGDGLALGCHDALLRKHKLVADVVLRFGDVPTSDVLRAAMAGCAAAQHLHISADGRWADDEHLTTWLLHADPVDVCRRLNAALTTHVPSEQAQRLAASEQRARAAFARHFAAAPWFDGAVSNAILDALPDDALLFLGNSLSVRNVEELGYARGKRLTVFGSRGASGIDGNVSTAFGIAVANPGRPLIALLGDITLYHDMNGLRAARDQAAAHVTLVVVNNDGGGIFRRLPTSKIGPPFEELFITPHGLEFSHAAIMYGLQYAHVTGTTQFRDVFARRMAGDPRGPMLIEARTDSRRDLEARTSLFDAVLAEL